MEAYITKYALTQGILKVDGEVCYDISASMITYKMPGCFTQYAHGNEWHKEKGDAILRAEEMRNAKIKSLKKKIEKLEKLVFKI